MQVACFGIAWDEVENRRTPERVVEEMIRTDDMPKKGTYTDEHVAKMEA